MGVVDEKVLGRVVAYAIKRSHTYRELHQRSRTHHVLNSLLSLSLQEMPFEKLLQECLEVILSKGKVLSVLVLYLKQGHVRIKEEEVFLRGVSDTLAGIIERARTSEQLVWANEQNSRLLSSLTSILIGVDNHDCITHWNEEAEQIFGVAAEQVLGKPITSSHIGWDWAQVTSNIIKNQNDYKQTKRFEVRFQPENGANRLLSVCATPFMDESGSRDGYLLIADDVTEQKQLDSEMQQMQKLQSIGQLAGQVLLMRSTSAFFGLGRHVSSPVDAASLLGLDVLKSLVLSIGIFKQFEADKFDIKSFSLDALWSHSAWVGSLAKQIAKEEGMGSRTVEDSLLAGMLHDIGKLILVINLSTGYAQLQEARRDTLDDRVSSEIEIFGATHGAVGAYLLGLWGLPESVVEAVALHNQPVLQGV
ncbi:MAG: HDOD domain-containing protein [Candidatus Thiodiazotropha sp. (ex Dulcina madagascariensis)]|nr:HDOD domain-containing protein [Candidatus Thiodiazotropha sp. (ex Dulcina madagascariensis)]